MRILTFTSVGVLALALAITAFAAEKTRFGVDASEWSSDTVAAPPSILPIGGSGQVNGDFVTGERNGVEIALRASRRFLQNVDPLENYKDKQVGVYLADTGFSDALERATWNYDMHVDLRGAKGVMKGKTLGDFDLVLETDIGETIFGASVPLDLGSALPAEVVLWQESWNPKFGNPPFDATAEGTYAFTLSLIPKTFNGPAISVTMRVVVSD